MIIMERRL